MQGQDQALVKNAADGKQVKNARRKEVDREKRRVDDLLFVINDPRGRRVLWDILEFCGYGRSPWDGRGDITNQNIGKGDVARYVISEIGNAGGLEAWLLMQREAWREKHNEHVEAEALRTASATSTAAQATTDAADRETA